METSVCFQVRDYDLAATLTSGQAFRWRQLGPAWEGIVQRRWVRLQQAPELDAGCSTLDAGSRSIGARCSAFSQIQATTSSPESDWSWLASYLRLDDDHAAQLATFPDDEPMRRATAHCPGLRLLRQEPWECLASFILSSTKQIVQIRQCVELLCEKFGDPLTKATAPHPASGHPLPIGCGEGRGETMAKSVSRSDSVNPTVCHRFGVPASAGPVFSITQRDRLKPGLQAGVHEQGQAGFAFPTAERLAAATEADLRGCKIGFRAKYLHAAARIVARGELDLASLETLPLEAARAELMRCPGVGRKVADCTLLFSCGFDAAFPIDVWVERALQQLYFPKRRVKRARLERFAATHFGSHAGLAQQYLFHYLRMTRGMGVKR